MLNVNVTRDGNKLTIKWTSPDGTQGDAALTCQGISELNMFHVATLGEALAEVGRAIGESAPAPLGTSLLILMLSKAAEMTQQMLATAGLTGDEEHDPDPYPGEPLVPHGNEPLPGSRMPRRGWDGASLVGSLPPV